MYTDEQINLYVNCYKENEIINVEKSTNIGEEEKEEIIKELANLSEMKEKYEKHQKIYF